MCHCTEISGLRGLESIEFPFFNAHLDKDKPFVLRQKG